MISTKDTKELNYDLKFYKPKTLHQNIFSKSIRTECLYFLDMMHRKWWQRQSDADGWTFLHSKLLEKMIGTRKLPHVKKELQEFAGLEIDHAYSKGNYSKAYRITDGFKLWHRITISNRRFYNKLKQVTYQYLSLPIHQHLKSMLKGLTIDLEAAEKMIPTLKPKKDSPYTLEDYRLRAWAMCEAIAEDPTQEFTVDPYGRVHTLLTRLSTDLRSCLYLNGEPLYSIDLCNSQALICGLIAKRYYSSHSLRLSFLSKEFNSSSYSDVLINSFFNDSSFNSDSLNSVNSEDQENRGTKANNEDQVITEHIITQTPHPHPIPLCSVNDNRNDIESFISVCENGSFYESFTTDTLTREDIKTQFMTVWFGKAYWGSLLKNKIKEKYPSMIEFIDEIKKKEHERLAWTLQHYEASIFIGMIAQRIMEQHQDIPFLTLHDSIYTTKPYVEYVEYVIEDEFRKIGVKPTLKIEESKNEK